jgi:serine/threonine-protein kinase
MDEDLATHGPPARFGPYEVIRQLGRGGMATVFEGRHVDLAKRVALKVVHPTIAPDASTVRRLLREGRTAAAIRHPHVVDVIDVGMQDGKPYLVMELLEGEDLAQRLKRDAPLPIDVIAELVLPVIAGVAAAHDAGIVHRDLKPSNIFLAQRHRGIEPVVVDFGLSRLEEGAFDPSSTRSQVVAGTAQYMAPEQLRGSKGLTARTDVYALGVVLYECATGGTPFWGDDAYELAHAVMTAAVVPPSELNPDVPGGFDAIVLRALARDPAQRFATVRALGAALLPFAGPEAQKQWGAEFPAVPEPVVEAAATPVAPRARASRRRAVGAAIGIAAIGGASLAAVHATRADHATIAAPVAEPVRVTTVTRPELDPPLAPSAAPATPALPPSAPSSARTPPRVEAPRRPMPVSAAARPSASTPPAVERGTQNIPIVE